MKLKLVVLVSLSLCTLSKLSARPILNKATKQWTYTIKNGTKNKKDLVLEMMPLPENANVMKDEPEKNTWQNFTPHEYCPRALNAITRDRAVGYDHQAKRYVIYFGATFMNHENQNEGAIAVIKLRVNTTLKFFTGWTELEFETPPSLKEMLKPFDFAGKPQDANRGVGPISLSGPSKEISIQQRGQSVGAAVQGESSRIILRQPWGYHFLTGSGIASGFENGQLQVVADSIIFFTIDEPGSSN